MAATTAATTLSDVSFAGEDEESIYSTGAESMSSNHSSSDGDEDDEKRLNFPRETRTITILRVAMLSVLILSGLLLSTCIYFYASYNNINDSSTLKAQHQQEHMRAILQAFPRRLARVVEELDRLAVELKILAQHDQEHDSIITAATTGSWPYVVFSEFEWLANKTREAANLEAIALLPLVDAAGLDEWQDFATTHLDEWLDASLSFQGQENDDQDKRLLPVFDASTGQAIVTPSVGPVFPLWELSPAVPQATIYNANLLSPTTSLKSPPSIHAASSAAVSQALEQVVSSNKVVVGESIHVAPWEQPVVAQVGNEKEEVPLVGTLFYPILLDKRLVGVLFATFQWQSVLQDILVSSQLDEEAASFVCNLKNENQTLSFLLRTASASTQGNNTVLRLDQGHTQAGWKTSQAQDSVVPPFLVQDDLGYMLQVYPYEEQGQLAMTVSSTGTTDPVVYAVIVALLFLFMALLFLSYDAVVQRRQKETLSAAVRSTNLISSLFPARVRDRLLRQHPTNSGASGHCKNKGTSTSEAVPFGDLPESDADSDNNNNNNNNKEASTSRASPKRRLRHFLRDSSPDATPLPSSSLHHPAKKNSNICSDDAPTTKPIADFFPNTTVMFADIVGFTAWSSEREPTQVFTLLQNVYAAFDRAARKRNVFKVETIGDSYVAVTGLPDPQGDHAERMAGFALECRVRLKEVTRKLERSLGPETGDLSMRFGLHSGPVTAGVLIGERSRFQLFGDTVNTAARMESSGQRGSIHVSESTANLLIEAGKAHWVTQREEKVTVKGKGEMQTFWLDAQVFSTRTTASGSEDGGETFRCDSQMTTEESPNGVTVDMVEDVAAFPPKRTLRQQRGEIWGKSEVFDSMSPPSLTRRSSDPLSRLTDWNVDVLLRLLKQVVASRMSRSESTKMNEEQSDFTAPMVGCALDEVAEIIALPAFDPSTASEQVDPESVEIDDDVVDQLREYVSNIARLYRDNPFHNFEHACHVQMSMMKLLQRIVSPDAINCEGESAASDAHKYTYGITSDPLTQFAVVFCALIHDVDHTGVANGQLVKENAPVATHYDNKSVAEQNSIELAWDLLMDPNYLELRQCIFSNESEFKRFRQLVVNVVLATDIFDKELSALRKKRWNTAFSEEEAMKESPVDHANRKATIVIEHLIQASDVSHTMQHFDIYRKWNERLFFEMYTAFQVGRTDTDPSVGWYKGELWFFDCYVIPLANKLRECGVFGVSSDECLNYALENRRMWADKGEQIVAEMVATDYFARLKEESQTRKSRRRMKKKLSIGN